MSLPSFVPLAAFLALAAAVSPAATLSSGSATITYHPAAWASLAGGSPVPGFEALILDEFFDQAAAESRTSSQILNDEVQANPATSGLVHAMNGITVVNLSGRTAQPTTFAFSPGNPTGHTGSIGLGGVSRWDVNSLLGGGNLVAGDFTLAYDASRQLVGGSGWALTNHIVPAGVVFDLTNVLITENAGSLAISGDLSMSFEVANFVLGSAADQGRDMGDFNFTATVVPEPASLLLSALSSLLVLRRRRH